MLKEYNPIKVFISTTFKSFCCLNIMKHSGTQTSTLEKHICARNPPWTNFLVMQMKVHSWISLQDDHFHYVLVLRQKFLDVLKINSNCFCNNSSF
ncbi:hypothetical protein X975_23287, partial [Stegodyphus mimosarum]